MRRIAVIVLVLLGIYRTCSAQVLFAISGKSSRDKSYLLATNRHVDMTFIDTIPNAFRCFSRCNKVITEFAMQDYEALAALRQAAILPDSVRLTNFYDDMDYELFCSAADNVHFVDGAVFEDIFYPTLQQIIIGSNTVQNSIESLRDSIQAQIDKRYNNK